MRPNFPAETAKPMVPTMKAGFCAHTCMHLNVWRPAAHVEIVEVLECAAGHHACARAGHSFGEPGLGALIPPLL